MFTNPVGVFSLSKREIYRFLTLAGQTVFPPIVSSGLFMYIFGVAIGSHIHFYGKDDLAYLSFIVPGLMTLHLVSSSYENTSSSLFIARWQNHIEEVLLAPLSYIEIVLGLLSGGVARGTIVCFGVFCVSQFFSPSIMAHPFLLLYFTITISIIFSCAGIMGALWSEDFGTLSIWNIYLIVPLVLLGGVFHPLNSLPAIVQNFAKFNPMFYLIEGVRYSVNGESDISIPLCAFISLSLASVFFFFTVYLFWSGYKLRK